jgi:hypothetical protein
MAGDLGKRRYHPDGVVPPNGDATLLGRDASPELGEKSTESEVARSAARRAVVETIQPRFDAALAELEAARKERAELVRAHGR